MAKLILDYYNGEDIYNDGLAEENLLNHYKSNKKLDLNQENIFYLTTDIRQNILNWYPFTKKDDILEIGCGCGTITGMLCEKAKSVTAIDGSKRRSKVTYYRHINFDNLNVYAGNFDDIEIEKKFDYIILIGVFEYAKLFFKSPHPFDDFLEKIKKMLKTSGKVLLAIENRYGIKYWAGCNEDHLGKPYIGLESYNQFNVQTFGRNEFIKIIDKHGFTKYKFYYPFPDYKLPTVVYTDEHLPTKEEVFNIPIFPYGNCINFDIHKTLSGFLDNDSFGFFSNSFLIEFGKKDSQMSEVIYARNLSYRTDSFKIITLETNANQYVKIANNSYSENHLNNLLKNHNLLLKNGIKACRIKKENKKFLIEKINGKNITEIINKFIIDKNIDKINEELDKMVDFYKSISYNSKISNPIIQDIKKVYKNEVSILKFSIIDGNVSNIIIDKNDNYVFIDQEWLEEKQLPTDYLIYFSLCYIWKCCPNIQSYILFSDILNKYNINKAKINLFKKIETYYFEEKNKVIDTNVQNILSNCSEFKDVNKVVESCLIYYDIGNDFTEDNKLFGKYNKIDNNLYNVEFKLPNNVKRIRFDPSITGKKLIYINNLKVNNKKINYTGYNIQIINGRETLCSDYPFFVFEYNKTELIISIELEKFSEKDIENYIKTTNDEHKNIDEINQKIKELNENLKNMTYNVEKLEIKNKELIKEKAKFESKNKKLTNINYKIIKENQNIINENKKYNEQLLSILNSKGWKTIEKIRKFKKIIKK